MPQEDNNYRVLELEEILEIVVFTSLILEGHQRVFKMKFKNKILVFQKSNFKKQMNVTYSFTTLLINKC